MPLDGSIQSRWRYEHSHGPPEEQQYSQRSGLQVSGIKIVKFRNFRDGLIFANFADAKFREMKQTQIDEIALHVPFTDGDESCPSRDFLTSHICL